jgi:hypothetical protein
MVAQAAHHQGRASVSEETKVDLAHCQQCGAPCEVTKRYTMVGAGFSKVGLYPVDIIIDMARTSCIAGHAIDVEVDSVEYR